MYVPVGNINIHHKYLYLKMHVIFYFKTLDISQCETRATNNNSINQSICRSSREISLAPRITISRHVLLPRSSQPLALSLPRFSRTFISRLSPESRSRI